MFIFNVITFESYFGMDKHFMLFIADCVWNFYQMSFVLIIICFGSLSTKKGQKTLNIVYKIINESVYDELVEKKVNIS